MYKIKEKSKENIFDLFFNVYENIYTLTLRFATGSSNI